MKARAGYLFASMTLLLTSFAVSTIFAKMAPTESLRNYNLYLPMLAGLSQLCLFGQATGITVLRFGTGYDRLNKSTLTITAVTTILAASLVVSLGILLYATATGLDIILAQAIVVAAIGLAFRDFSINLFQISRNLRLLQLMALLSLIVMCSLLYVSPSFNTLLLGYACLIPAALLALGVYIRRSSERMWRPDASIGRALLREGWPTIPGVFLGAFAAFGLRYTSENALSIADFNATAFAMTVSISLFGTALGAYFRTDVIGASEEIAAGDRDAAKRIVDRIHLVLGGIVILAVLVSETIGNTVVVGVFGDRFSGYYRIFAVFAIVSGLSFSASIYSLFLQYNGRMLLSVALSLTAPILALALVVLVPHLDIIWLCVLVALANLIGLLTMLVSTRRFRHSSLSGYVLAAVSSVCAVLLIFLHSTVI